MKKFTKILLFSVSALILLTGCYQQDVTLNFNHSGAEFSTEIVATDEAYNYYTNNNNQEQPITHSDILDQNLPYLQEYTKDDANLKIEAVDKEIDGEMYYGLKASGKYKNANEMLTSEFFSNLNSISIYPEDDRLKEYIESNHMGIAYKEKTNVFGTSYQLNGYVSLTQGRSANGELSEDELALLEKAKSTLHLKFPVFSFSFSKGCKFFLAPSFEYDLNYKTTDMPVDISVFVPNLAVFAFGLIIILLLIIISMLLKKIRILTSVPETEEEEHEEEMLSEDDENFFEGNEENTEFIEESEEAVEAEDAEVSENTEIAEDDEDKEDEKNQSEE